jgi:hypothetical protein
MSRSKEVREFLSTLPVEDQLDAVSYLLTKLLGEPITASTDLAIHRVDGTVLGYVRSLRPPAEADVSEMNERARKVKPTAGRSPSGLLKRMRSGDEAGVRAFTQDRAKLDC